jgi:type II secretory pathway pseudopilin PulG
MTIASDEMKTLKHNQLINYSGNNSGIRMLKRQSGVTLIEAMISLALSLIVTSAMVVLMANSMGTSTRIIQMSQLSDELRNAMSMMTRDVRRANYSANSIFCYGNSECGYKAPDPDRSALQVGDIQIGGGGSCFTFTLDRSFNGDATDDAAGGFRLLPHPTIISTETGLGVGVIQMWTGIIGTSPGCGDAYDKVEWVELTDPDTVNIMEFAIAHTGPIPEEVAESKTKTFLNRQREIKISLEGQLVIEEDMGNVMVERRIEDTIYVRNDYIIEPI